jgi:hypothetical protein
MLQVFHEAVLPFFRIIGCQNVKCQEGRDDDSYLFHVAVLLVQDQDGIRSTQYSQLHPDRGTRVLEMCNSLLAGRGVIIRTILFRNETV